MSSIRPEMVALREYLESHPDNENLLYLTDSEATLQGLRVIIVKLQQRVKAKVATLLIKVKTHRDIGDDHLMKRRTSDPRWDG